MAKNRKGKAGSRRTLVNAGVLFLKSIGATDIRYNHKIEGVIVDLFASFPEDKSLAVLCGMSVTEDKLLTIANNADIFYWIPVPPLLFQVEARDMDQYMIDNGLLHCNKCSYDWEPRVEEPALCPKCKSRDWNKEVKDEVGVKPESTIES